MASHPSVYYPDFSADFPDCGAPDQSSDQPLAKRTREDYNPRDGGNPSSRPIYNDYHTSGPNVTNPGTQAFDPRPYPDHWGLPILQAAQAPSNVGQSFENVNQQPSLPISFPMRQDIAPNQVPVLPSTIAVHYDDYQTTLSQPGYAGLDARNNENTTLQSSQWGFTNLNTPSAFFASPTNNALSPSYLSGMDASTVMQVAEIEDAEQNCNSDPAQLALAMDSELTLFDSDQDLVCFGMIMEIPAELSDNATFKGTGTSSPVPVRLHSSGDFTGLDDPNARGHITMDSLKMVQGLTVESSLTLQVSCTLEDQSSGAVPKKRPHVNQHKVCLGIILYGPMYLFDDVGEYVQHHGIYLQDPKGCDLNVLYCNPHNLRPIDGEPYPYTFDLDQVDQQTTSVALEGLPEEHDLLEALNTSETLHETQQPAAIKAQLGSHQKQALTFMLRREKGWAFDGSWPDIWETAETSHGSCYVNKISHAVQTEPPNQFCGGIIADPMGLGKTLTMIALIASDTDNSFESRRLLREEPDISFPRFRGGLTLIVVPLSLLPTWEEQLTEHVHERALKWRRHYGKLRLSSTESLNECDIVLTTYQTLSSEWRKHVDLQRSVLFRDSWRRVILDEAHVIRNSSSQLAKAICALEADSRWAVTGTPLQNRLGDLATLLKFLRPYPYGDAKQFDSDIGRLWKAGDLEEAVKRLKRLMRCLVLRRPKTTIDLPPRHNLLCPLDFSHAELSTYNEAKERAIKRIDEALYSSDTSGAYANALQQIDALRMICNLGSHYRPSGQLRKTKLQTDDWDNHAQQAFDSQREFGDVSCCLCKLTLDATESTIAETNTQCSPLFSRCTKFICAGCTSNGASRLVELSCGHTPQCPLARVSVNGFANQVGLASGTLLHLEALPTKISALVAEVKALEKDVKCVVFSYWRSTLDLIQSALAHASVITVRFDGGLSPKDRQASVDKFRKDSSVQVMLLTLSCGAVGLTLTVASRAYLMEPHWNPTVEEQALARIHRIGQTKEITTIRFFMRGTLEEHVIEVQKKKKHLADVLLSARNDTGSDENASRLEWLRSLL